MILFTTIFHNERGYRMNTKEIDILIEDFEDKTKEINDYLSMALEIISQGKILDKELESKINTSFNDLDGKYEFIKSRLCEIYGEEIVPNEIVPVREFQNIIFENEKKIIKERVKKAEQVLHTFLQVKSAIEGYATALKPIQDNVQLRIDKQEHGDLNDDEVINEAFLPQLFIEAVTMDDLDSDRGMEILDQIGEVYPKRVMAGVAAGKYYIETDSDISRNNYVREDYIEGDNESNQKEDNSDIKLENSQMVDEDTDKNLEGLHVVVDDAIKLSDDSQVTDKEDKESEVIQSVNEDVDIKSESSQVLSEEKLDEDSIYDKNELNVEQDNDDGEAQQEIKDATNYIEASNNPKSGTPNASSFKKELRNLPKPVGFILPILTNFGLLSESQIYQIGVFTDVIDDEKGDAKEGLGPLLEKLAIKGWLARYELDGITVYCISNFVYRTLMEKNSIQKNSVIKWCFSFGEYDFKPQKKMSRDKIIKSYRSNVAIIDYLSAIRTSVDKKCFESILASLKWENNYYNVAISVDSEMKITRLLLSDDVALQDNIDDFLWIPENEEKELNVLDNIQTVYVLNNNTVVSLIPKNGKIILEDNDEQIVNENEAIESQTHVEEIEAHNIDDEKNFEQNSETLEEEMRALTDVHRAMTDSELYDFSLALLNDQDINDKTVEKVANAVLLMKAASMETENIMCQNLYKKLLYATRSAVGEVSYTYTAISEVFNYDEPDSLLLSTQMYAMLIPGMAYDHGLHGYSDRFLSEFDRIFPGCNRLKGFFNQLNRIWKVTPNGYTPAAMALIGDDQENQKFTSDIQAQAKQLMIVPSAKSQMNTLPVMYNSTFGSNSDFYDCLEIVLENNVEKIDEVKLLLEYYCDVVDGQYNLSVSKTESILDKKWNDANPGNYFPLQYNARPQTLKHFYSRINLLKTWVEHSESLGGKNIDISKLKTLRDEIIKEADKAITRFNEVNIENKGVLYSTIINIKTYLSGEKLSSPYLSALYTGRLSLDDNYIPIIDDQTAGIKYCEPWRSVIKHIEFQPLSKEEIIEQINDRNSLIFDNLNQLEKLGRTIESESEEYFIPESRIKKAIDAADARTTKFRERLELAYTYDQINENDKETLAAIVEQQKERFYAIKDFGCWRQFLDGLERQILESALKGKRELKEKISDRLKKDPESTVLLEAERLLEKDTNLAVTEEYLNRYDAGEKEISIEMENYLTPRNDFSNFLSDEVYGPLLEYGKQKSSSGALKYWGWNFISGKLPADWTSRLREDSKKLIEAWPAGKKGSNESRIMTLFKGLGFPVEGIKILKDSKEEVFRLELKPTPRSMADYPHPIAAFGTQMKRFMNVIVLYGNHTPSQIVETVSRMDSKGFSIVLIDRPLERVTRRQIGELSHQKSGQNPFILIDWVLILHLAMQDNTNRLPVLLACSLPYTTYQPFVRDGGPTADEMFCGRTKELNTIMDRNGASVVYGGRQLGKTALLERAESRCHRPENKEYAVFCTLIHKKTEGEVTEHIIDAINKKTELGLKTSKTLKELCAQIEILFRNGTVSSFLLLLDECDDFLGAIADNSYKQIQDMINLKRDTQNAFKFVLAGLHNVCRAKNSTEKNGVFGQLGEPLCVRPLQPAEALQLLSRPLCYQGFQIDPYPHLKTILTKTNYYPGILQFFGYKLLETLTDQYSKYYSASKGNPPFTLKDEQLGAVLSSADLNNSIKAKFRWSLELDQRYFMIARCITMLYYFEQEERRGNWKGFSIEQIMGMANEYDIHCLHNMLVSDFKNLLDEMVDMGILSKTENEAYRLRRSSFIGIIGADMDSLDKDIIDNNQEVTG